MATSFMFMDLPVVSTTPGPEWSSLLNDALSEVVDSHDHTSGKGVPIKSASINIDADLDFQQWSAINLVSSQYVDQADALSGTNLTYFLSGDLYVIDGSGRSVRITENGAISAASFGGITGLVSPASASFATDTFTWLYDTGKYALMASGPLLLRRDGETNPQAIRITPPASLAAAYTLTLPGALPASNAYLYADNSGALAFATAALSNSVNTAAIQGSAVSTAKIADGAVSSVKIAASNVVTSKIADANVTRAKLEAVGQQVSSGATFNLTTPATWTDVTGVTVTITTSGRPVVVKALASSTSAASLSAYNLSGGTITAGWRIAVSGSTTENRATFQFDMVTGAPTVYFSPSSVEAFCVYGAGTYTFQLQTYHTLGSILNGTTVTSAANMIAYEL